MAIKSIGKIVLYESLNQNKIDALLASDDTIILEIERRYALTNSPGTLSAVLPTQFDDVTINYIDAFKKVIDASTWVHEENVLIFKIAYDADDKEFDLTNSYVRDVRDTTSALGAIPTGQLLNATFITPGLDAPIYTTIELPFGEDILTEDRDLMLGIGLELNLGSTGNLFSIKTQKVPYKVFFSQPSSVTVDKYSIEFDLQNKTIEV